MVNLYSELISNSSNYTLVPNDHLEMRNRFVETQKFLFEAVMTFKVKM